MNPENLLLYWHTIRHLKLVQVLDRVAYRLHQPTPEPREAPPVSETNGRWRAPTTRAICMTGPVQFRFLGQIGTCERAEDWNDPCRDKLWLYNLHYFDDLTAADAGARRSWHANLIVRWIRENPPPRGCGWEAYPTSLRIVNWIKWALSGQAPPPGFHDSLAIQARWLSRRIEHHLMGNHLLANAKALVFAGTYFTGNEAAQWRALGLHLLDGELAEQILADGAHYERSPMYHLIVLEDVLDLINVSGVREGCIDRASVDSWRDIACRMFGWAAALTHPDGDIAFFNDAAFDIAATPAQLRAYAARLELRAPTTHPELSESGYIRAEIGGAVLIADIGSIGPDHQPGHAHADTLSFELSIGHQRVIVNSGTSTYAIGSQRQRERATAAHNTVEIDGLDSSEVWGAFRVARRALPHDVAVERRPDAVTIRGAHDGYRRLRGRPLHHRQWRLEPGRLRIADRITGSCKSAIARCHLHPSIRVDGDAMQLANGTTCRWSLRGGRARVVASHWHPRFGATEPNQCIEIVFEGREVVFEVEW